MRQISRTGVLSPLTLALVPLMSLRTFEGYSRWLRRCSCRGLRATEEELKERASHYEGDLREARRCHAEVCLASV